MSKSGSPMRSRASFQAWRRPIDRAAMSRKSARSATGPRSASSAIAWFTLLAPVSRSCLSIRVASRTASCRMTCCARERAFTTARTADAPPAAAGAASTGSPVSEVAHEAATSAVHTSSATSVRASSHPQPVAATRVRSCAHHLAAVAETNTGMRARGGGAPTARTATMTANPALNAAGISIIKAVQQARRVADLRKLGPHAFRHRRRGTDTVPAAILAQSDELLQQGTSSVETRDAAHGEKLSLPRMIERTSDDRRVQHEVDGVHDLGKHSLGARRLRVAKRQSDWIYSHGELEIPPGALLSAESLHLRERF